MYRPAKTPVFVWEPSWDQGVAETLTWKTAISTSLSLVEQRVAKRVWPRLTLEYAVAEWDNESARIEAFVRQTGTLLFYVPFWPDAAQITNSVVAGFEFLPFETSGQFFRMSDGNDLGVVLVFQDNDNYDVLTISAIYDNGILTENGPAFDLGVGCKVVPLLLMRFPQSPAVTITSAHVKQGTFQFESAQAIKLSSTCSRALCDAKFGTQYIYNDRPVITTAPDDAVGPTVTFDRQTVEFDSETGLTRFLDVSGRSLRKQSYRVTTMGIGETGALRYLLFTLLRGMQGALWVPSFSNDLYLTQDVANDINLHVQNVGYSLNGGPAMGIDRVIFFNTDGSYIMETIVNCQENDTFNETLAMNVAHNITKNSTTVISWVALMRLSADAITINHVLPNGAYATCDLPFVNTHNDSVGLV